MSAVKDEVASVVRTEVPEYGRLDFLPERVGKYVAKFEMNVYRYAEEMCPEYNGGYWDFYTLSNGGWYIAPRMAQPRLAVSVASNYFQGVLSPDALGIAVSITVLNHLMWAIHQNDMPMGKKLNDYYFQLRNYAAEHAEAAGIFGAID